MCLIKLRVELIFNSFFCFILFYFHFYFQLQNFEDVTRKMCLYFRGLKSHSVPRFEPKDNPIFWALKIYMVLELRATHEVISENTNSGSTRVKFNFHRGPSDLTVVNTQTNVSAKIRIQSNLSPQLPPRGQKKVARRCGEVASIGRWGLFLGEVMEVHFCWVCAGGLSVLLPHYNDFLSPIIDPTLDTFVQICNCLYLN